MDVEHRERQGPPGDRAGRCLGDLTVLDQADVAGGAAHVEAEHVEFAREFRQQLRAPDPSGRPGEHRERCVCGRALRAGEPPGGLHHLGSRKADLLGPGAEAPQVDAEQWGERGVDLGGGRALVLAERADEFVGERHVYPRQARGEQIPQQPLVLGMRVGVQEHHRDRLGRCSLAGAPREPLDQPARRLGVERPEGALRGHALRRAEAQLRRGQRRRGRDAQVVEFGAVLAAELDEVGEALGRHERRARPAPLEQRVGRDGHAVREALHLTRMGPGASQ